MCGRVLSGQRREQGAHPLRRASPTPVTCNDLESRRVPRSEVLVPCLLPFQDSRCLIWSAHGQGGRRAGDRAMPFIRSIGRGFCWACPSTMSATSLSDCAHRGRAGAARRIDRVASGRWSLAARSVSNAHTPCRKPLPTPACRCPWRRPALIGLLHRGQQHLRSAGERDLHPQAQKVPPTSEARMPLDPEHQALIDAVPRTPESQSTRMDEAPRGRAPPPASGP